MLHTTLKHLRYHFACMPRYRKLRESLPRDHASDTPISLLHVLEFNGIKDAVWALRATIEPDGETMAREFICRVTENVLPTFEGLFPDDKRPREAIEAARAYNKGTISAARLHAKYLAARDAYISVCALRALYATGVGRVPHFALLATAQHSCHYGARTVLDFTYSPVRRKAWTACFRELLEQYGAQP